MLEPIEVVAYLANNSSEDLDSSSDDMASTASVSGMAVKNGATTWTVILQNKQQLSVTNADLMDPLQFFVKRKWLSDDVNTMEKKKQSAKQKRVRLSKKHQKEKTIREKAMEELRKFEKTEFENMLTKARSGSSYEFQDFLEMVDRIRKPFTCFVEGHEVSLTQDDCAIMLEKSVMKEITESLFHGSQK